MSDIRYALRSLARQPSYTAAAVLTLTLGIAVNTVAFSLINALVLRPMPVPDAARVVRVAPVDANGVRGNLVSYPDYLDYRRADDGFETLAAYLPSEMTAGRSSLDRGAVEPRSVIGYVAWANYFELTGIRASRGRVLLAADDRPGSRSAVVSEAFWRTRLGGDPAAIGSTLMLNGTAFTIVGIAAPGFTEPLVADCWLPLDALTVIDAHDPLDRDHGAVLVVGRLSPGRDKELSLYLPIDAGPLSVDPRDLHILVRTTGDAASVRRELTARAAVLAGDMRFTPFALEELLRIWMLPSRAAGTGTAVLALLALSLACVGLYGVLTFAVGERSRELGIRMALGADRSAVVRLILGDATRLVLLGLAIGTACALPATPILGRLLFGVSPFDAVSLTGAAAFLTVVALGAAYRPARRASRLEPLAALRME